MSASISGPIVGGSQGRPFSVPVADLATRGYVAEEYFIDGTASAYAPASDAPFTADGRRRGVDDLVAAGGLRAEDAAARHDDAEKIAADLDL